MGFLKLITEPLRNLLGTSSTGAVLAALTLSLIVLAIVLNVLHQLVFRNPSDPPLVFHWVPFFGSTITYGIDPYHFFFRSREKVFSLCASRSAWPTLTSFTVRRRLHVYSAWQEDYCLPWSQRERLYIEWEA